MANEIERFTPFFFFFQGTSYVDENVTANKEYEYRVTAVNDAGPGEPSDSSAGIVAKPEKGTDHPHPHGEYNRLVRSRKTFVRLEWIVRSTRQEGNSHQGWRTTNDRSSDQWFAPTDHHVGQGRRASASDKRVGCTVTHCFTCILSIQHPTGQRRCALEVAQAIVEAYGHGKIQSPTEERLRRRRVRDRRHRLRPTGCPSRTARNDRDHQRFGLAAMESTEGQRRQRYHRLHHREMRRELRSMGESTGYILPAEGNDQRSRDEQEVQIPSEGGEYLRYRRTLGNNVEHHRQTALR